MRHEVTSEVVQDGGVCGFLALFLDVAQYDRHERSVWFRECEQYLSVGADRYPRCAGHGLAKIAHSLAMA
jgi:hypothetical protein